MANDAILTYSDYQDDPSPMLYKAAMDYEAWLRALYLEYQGTAAPAVPNTLTNSVDAMVNGSRWVWMCPTCNAALPAEPGEPSICPECGLLGWVSVTFPSNRSAIETELLRMPGYRTRAWVRHWMPGWTITELEARTARTNTLAAAGVNPVRALSIGVPLATTVGQVLTAAFMNVNYRGPILDLSGDNGPVQFRDTIQLDSGTTAQRSATPANGMLRYNTSLNVFERYENGAWVLSTHLTALTATGAARGDLVFIDSNGNLKLLAAGTDGHHLRAKGANADPIWEATVIPAGTIHDFAGTTTPAGFLTCDGSAVSRTTYASLFTAIGTTWGTGNGATTFNVPDLRRHTTIGSAGTQVSGPGTSVGNTGGAETHTLTTSELPSHLHALLPLHQSGGTSSATLAYRTILTTNPVTLSTNTTGGGGAHNSMQPSAVVLKIIKT